MLSASIKFLATRACLAKARGNNMGKDGRRQGDQNSQLSRTLGIPDTSDLKKAPAWLVPHTLLTPPPPAKGSKEP